MEDRSKKIITASAMKFCQKQKPQEINMYMKQTGVTDKLHHLSMWHVSSLRSKRFRLVSEQRKTEERDSRFWPREKWNKGQKMKVGGGGGGRKRLQTNPSILKTWVRQQTQRLIGSASRTMLTCVDHRFFYGMVRDTLIFSGCCLFWSARFALKCKNIFSDLFWNVRLFLPLNKGFRSFDLFSKVPPGSE